MTRRLTCLFFATLLAACGSGPGTGEKALAAVRNGALLVDVRTPAEFAGGHLPGAINIPHGEIVAGLNSLQVPPTAPVILYCRSGNRSGIAADSLARAGFSDAVNAGAYSELKPLWDADR